MKLALVHPVDSHVVDTSSLSLDIPAETTFDEWVDLGRQLCSNAKAINWWIGDWWAFGDHEYGVLAKAAAEGIWGREFGTLSNYGSVSRSFKETSRRRELLTFTHHVEVAALSAAEADELLDLAAQENLSTRDLRAAVQERREQKVVAALTRDPPTEAQLHQREVSALRNLWNCSRPSARREFLEAATEAELGPLEND